ncbi:hydrogenase maturation nickel metallochaperone HypA [Chitinophagaceae bacterium LB-8]|uniref:Hydrogenase maturation factor HypA n=1 Tax=Paraflavisolibacter caeni TaxID=2982496 RepID=A0A9X3BHT4_9BACT|nr:hydrogenase maturation nickel metallochaperone HypA [Paraflavisolibacter caeni]MCU7549143.1 hydrogenase maturation nickel metallochaperone HypA [Paraflavisolibacter caeni]
MHELSLILNIIDIAQKEAIKANATAIEEIELDIGCLSTVEMDAFEFAWNIAIKGTMLESTIKKFNRIKGKAKCQHCGAEFSIQHLYDPCPACKHHVLNILQGKELSVKSLVVS